ncbi:MAG: hypothetical protein ACO1OB_29535 [Archangium sp.]
MRSLLFVLLFCGCVTSRFVQKQEGFEPRPSDEEVPLVPLSEVPNTAKAVGRIEVFHANVTPRERIISKALTEARLLGCTWLVHQNPKGNAEVKTEGFEIIIGASGTLGPPQAEGENRADFWCLVR